MCGASVHQVETWYWLECDKHNLRVYSKRHGPTAGLPFWQSTWELQVCQRNEKKTLTVDKAGHKAGFLVCSMWRSWSCAFQSDLFLDFSPASPPLLLPSVLLSLWSPIALTLLPCLGRLELSWKKVPSWWLLMYPLYSKPESASWPRTQLTVELIQSYTEGSCYSPWLPWGWILRGLLGSRSLGYAFSTIDGITLYISSEGPIPGCLLPRLPAGLSDSSWDCSR